MNSPNICHKKQNYNVNLEKKKLKGLNIMMKKMKKRRRRNSQRVKNQQIPKNQKRKKIRLLKIKIK